MQEADVGSFVAEEAKIFLFKTFTVPISHNFPQILCKYDRSWRLRVSTSGDAHYLKLCSILLAKHNQKGQTLFELGSHFVAQTRHILALSPSLKIMRLFDVRPLRAAIRGVDCSGHMKALQFIWTMSGHYGAGPRHHGGLLTLWRGAGFNDRGNS